MPAQFKLIIFTIFLLFSSSSPDCGVGINRIALGVPSRYEATINEHPWMALLRYENSKGVDVGSHCTGTLISDKYILTAAHCIYTSSYDLNLKSIRLGEWDLGSNRDCQLVNSQLLCSDPVVDVWINYTKAHSYYDRKTGNNDIALIRLAQPITFSVLDFISPVCLPWNSSTSLEVGRTLTACGWDLENVAVYSRKLLVKLPVIAHDVCAESYKRLSIKLELKKNQICAGGEYQKDVCKGNSGGPLMRMSYVDGEVRWFQEGIVAKGVGCGQAVPGIYTRLALYLNWIRLNTRN